MSKRSTHGTHVWVRTELVEAILHHQGSLPEAWNQASSHIGAPSRSFATGRYARDGSTISVANWGWARATLSGATSPRVLPQENGNQTNDKPFGSVKLRKTAASPEDEADKSAPKLVKATIVIDDEEFAPSHLLHMPVSLTYDANDSSLVCMANSWWYTPPNDDESNPEQVNRPLNHHASSSPPEDLTNLSHLHEPAVVFCLQRRYKQDAIYTYTGKVLLALNPFRPVDSVYSEDVMHQYWNMEGQQEQRPPPHAYAIAEDAYRSLVGSLMQHTLSTSLPSSSQGNRVGRDQSILVSGESGAGKTVTTKIVMKYLTTLSRRSNQHDGLICAGGNIQNSIEAQGMQEAMRNALS